MNIENIKTEIKLLHLFLALFFSAIDLAFGESIIVEVDDCKSDLH